MLNGHGVIHPQFIHHPQKALGTKEAHEIIFQGNKELGRTRVTLAAGTAPELIVNAAGFVAFSADNVQAPQLGHSFLENNVSAPASHIGGNGNSPFASCLGHYFRFPLMLLGIEDIMNNSPFFQHFTKQLRFFNGYCPHQQGLSSVVATNYFLHHRLEFTLLSAVDHIRQGLANHWPVCGNDHHIHAVDLAELIFLGFGGAGKARKLCIHAEVVLQSNAGQGLALPLDLDAFLGLNGLVQAVGITAPKHQAAGELIDDDDLPFLDHIVPVPFHEHMCPQGLVDMMGNLNVNVIIEIFQIEGLFHLGHALFCQSHCPRLLIQCVISFRTQAGHQLGIAVILAGILVDSPGDYQGRAGLINEDAVHLVDNGKMQGALHQMFLVQHHIIPEIVKAKLVICAISYICLIGLPALFGIKAMDNETYLQAQQIVDPSHPLAVEAGKIVVDGDHMHALARESIEIGRHSQGQGLALAGFHFRNPPLVEDDSP